MSGNFVGGEATGLVVGEGVGAVEGAGVEPDTGGAVVVGALHAKREQVLAEPATVEWREEAEVGHLGAGLVGGAVELDVAGGRAAHVEHQDSDVRLGEIGAQLLVAPAVPVDPGPPSTNNRAL